MKKTLLLSIITVFTIGAFAQTIYKEFPYKDKERDYFFYEGSYPVNDNQVLTIFNFDKVYELHLYDKDFNEIASKKITKKKEGRYNTDMFLTKRHLLIKQDVNKKDYVIKVNINTELSHEKFEFNNGNFLSLKYNSSEDVYYYKSYKEGGYLNKFIPKTNETIEFKIKLAEKEDVYIRKFDIFKDNKSIAILRDKSVRKKTNYEILLHDDNGSEVSKFNRFENNILKSTVFFASNKEEVYCLGNYKELPKKDEIALYDEHNKKPVYTGIYIKDLKAEKPIEKYYKWAEFKNFNKNMIADKKFKKLPKFMFNLEDVVFLENEKIIFGTIEQNTYLRNDHAGKDYDGPQLDYILIFGINDVGEVAWDQVISLDWEEHTKVRQEDVDAKINNFPKTLNVTEESGIIKCHYLFRDNINSFEVKDGQLVNKKETSLMKKENNDKYIRFQYKNSVYWYDNFYFNDFGVGEAYELDKIKFNK